MTSATLTFHEWASVAKGMLEDMRIPVVEASYTRQSGPHVDFLPAHSVEDGFKRIVEIANPTLAVLWPEATEEGELVAWNFHLLGGVQDVRISCGEGVAVTGTADSRENSAAEGREDPGTDYEAFERHERQLFPNLKPAVEAALATALNRGLEPGDPEVTVLLSEQAAFSKIPEQLRPLLRSYLPYYGRHLIESAIVEAHRAEFRTHAATYARKILASESALEGLKKPGLMDVVWAYMKRTHGEQCAAKYILEPITDELRQLLRQGQRHQG